MGGIGRNMAKKLRAFGMSVQYYNRNKLNEELEDGAKYVGFEELLKTSDVISLNLPLNVCFIPLIFASRDEVHPRRAYTPSPFLRMFRARSPQCPCPP